MRSLLLGRLFILFLLVMEGSCSLPPRIPYLEVHEAGLTHQLFTNRSFLYSPATFQDFEIHCQSEDRSETVRQDILPRIRRHSF
jgi:hypothetical protein